MSCGLSAFSGNSRIATSSLAYLIEALLTVTFEKNRHIVLQTSKMYEDSDYDYLLEIFRVEHPTEFDKWTNIEKNSFENRRGLASYPDRGLMRFVQDFIASRSLDNHGGLGPSVAFRALRGRVLREILDSTPGINPAPGHILITEPRTCSGAELSQIIEQFAADHESVWRQWIEIERDGDFSDLDKSPLKAISREFCEFLRERFWVQDSSASTHAYSDVRKRIWAKLRTIGAG